MPAIATNALSQSSLLTSRPESHAPRTHRELGEQLPLGGPRSSLAFEPTPRDRHDPSKRIEHFKRRIGREVGADLVGKPRDAAKDPSANPNAKSRNRILPSHRIKQTPEARCVRASPREAHHEVGTATTKLRVEVVRLNPTAEKENIEAIRLGDPSKDLTSELLARGPPAGHKNLAAP